MFFPKKRSLLCLRSPAKRVCSAHRGFGNQPGALHRLQAHTFLAALLSLCYVRLDTTGSIVNTVILLCGDDANMNIPRREDQHCISPVAMAATA
jgi:hypothetical protein